MQRLFIISFRWNLSLLVLCLTFICFTNGVSAAAPVRIGIASQPMVALALIAEKKGFFQREGLSVTIRHFPSGKHALQAMFAGDIDIPTVAETPVVISSFDRTDFSLFATIASSRNEQRIVARKDSGIMKPSDLRGKRVATQHGSAIHFFLHLFLLKHGMTEKDIVLSYLKAEEMPAALAKGQIDAFCLREPFISEAQRLLPGKVSIFAEPNLYVMSFHLAAMNSYIQNNPDSIKKTVRALIKAEEFAKSNRSDSIRIVANELAISETSLTDKWPGLDLRIALEQSLLHGLEDEARWTQQMKLVDRNKKMPNFFNYLYLDALSSVRRSSVTVIR